MIKAGFLGFGYWGPNILRSLFQCKDVEVEIACDVNELNCQRIRELYPELKVTQNPAEIITDSSIDALFIATPAETHYLLAKQALEHKKHVFVEKPLATASREAWELTEIAGNCGKKLMVGHIFTFHPAVRRIKDEISAGNLGDIHYGYVQRTSLGPRVRNDVNVIWDYAIHDIYIAMHLFGGKPVHVSAVGKDALQKGIDDVVFITMEFESGVKYHIHSSWFDPEKTRKMVLVGSRKMISYDDMKKDDKVVIYDRGYAPYKGVDAYGNVNLELFDNGASPLSISDDMPLLAELQHFIDCIRDDKPVMTDGKAGSWTLEVIEELHAALEKNKRKQ